MPLRPQLSTHKQNSPMTRDANGKEFSGTEHERVRNRYWSYHCGDLLPAWLETAVGEDVLWIYHDRIFTRRDHFAWTEGWFYLGCAIELEHRSTPAQTLRQLRRLVAKVRQRGYDFTLAKSLEQEVRGLNSALWTEISLGTERMWAEVDEREIRDHPINKKLDREIHAKKLPRGMEANLALIHMIVDPKKK